MTDQTPGQNPLRHATFLQPHVGRSGSGPRIVGWLESRVRVSGSFPKNPLPISVVQQQKG